jgi:hypothetical protein
MKNLTGTILITLLLTMTAKSQDISHEFGQITAGDFNVNHFEGDTSVEAIVLYDIGTSKFVKGLSGFDIVFHRKTKIKILNTSGIDYSEIEIPYYLGSDGSEKVRDIEAFTYNFENGRLKRTALNKDNIFEEKMNENWMVKKFAMPDVREGSVIEFTYEIYSPYIFNLVDWEFQSSIPTLYSEYVVRTIPFYDYVYILQGVDKLHTQSSVVATGLSRDLAGAEFKDVINTFIMKDVPAFDDESYITSKQDYIMKIDFQLAKVTNVYGVEEEIISTWPKLCEQLLTEGDFSKFLKKSGKKVKKIANLQEYSSLSDNEKLKKAVEFVKENYRWNKRNGKFPQKDFKSFTTEKTGNCANMNLFLTSLLNSTGLEAHPVLISTRDHGRVYHNYPFHHFFNYVITLVKIGDGFVLADATDDLCPHNRIPFKCINNKGLIVKEGEEQWVNLTTSRISVVEEKMKLSFSDDISSLIGIFMVVATDYDALLFRQQYDDNHEKLEEQLNENQLDLIDSIKTRNFEDIEKPYMVYFKAESSVEKIGNKIFLGPFLNEPVAENPFKQAERRYPIDMQYKKARKYKSVISIPEGYELRELPENFNMDNKWMSIQFEFISNESKNEIIASASYTLKKAVYEADDYSTLKYMYNELIDKFNEKIVFSAAADSKQLSDQ